MAQKLLILDDDVTKKSGIYSYVLTRDDRSLNLRKFTLTQKIKAYEKQKGKCNDSKQHEVHENYFEIEDMEADHITPWKDGGKTTDENCQVLCKDCNRRKSGK